MLPVGSSALDGALSSTRVTMPERPARVLAFVAAHPDDDVMGAAGLIALRRGDPGLRFVLIHATDGERGEIAPDSDVTRDELGTIRRAEDQAGWEAVGRLPDRHEWFGFPDGGLASLPSGVLEQRIAVVFAEERPDVVLGFGPDGITGHPDHVAVGAATTAAFLRFAGDGDPGFRRLFHGAYPQSALDRSNARRTARGEAPYDPTRVFHPRGVPDEHIDCTIDQRSVVPAITAAFRAHRTQWAPFWAELDEQMWISAAGENHLVQAWPTRAAAAPRLRDPFEGL
jgi:LmbE family N-acetylglucosaminyl deacetylase